jgi:hypothetical protein
MEEEEKWRIVKYAELLARGATYEISENSS